MISSSHYSSLSSGSNADPHTIQPTVLAMCEAILPAMPSSSVNNNEWFLKLISQPQPVIVAPFPRLQAPPISSHRTIRVQIIHKHDDIAVPPPSSLSASTIDDPTTALLDYLTNTCSTFNMPNNQHVLEPVSDDAMGDETLQNSSDILLMDLDQHYDSNNWIDTALANFFNNSEDLIPLL